MYNIQTLSDFYAIGTLDMPYKRDVVERAMAENAKYIMVVCDTFDYDDYPVFIGQDESYLEKVREYNAKSMQQVMGVYQIDKE